MHQGIDEKHLHTLSASLHKNFKLLLKLQIGLPNFERPTLKFYMSSFFRYFGKFE